MKKKRYKKNSWIPLLQDMQGSVSLLKSFSAFQRIQIRLKQQMFFQVSSTVPVLNSQVQLQFFIFLASSSEDS